MSVEAADATAPEVLTNGVLHGRDRELADLRRMLRGARAGRGAALVLSGDRGAGRTALLAAARSAAAGFLVLETRGVPAERALPLSGLHLLCRPLDARAAAPPAPYGAAAPAPYEGALAALFGARPVGAAEPADAFSRCAAFHALLAAAGDRGPVLCLVDDADLLDPASLEVLAFAARRVAGLPVVLLFAVGDLTAADLAAGHLAAGHPAAGGSPAQGRTPEHGAGSGLRAALDGIPRTVLGPLDDEAAARILAERIPGEAAGELTEDLLELASGNPLALVELAAALTPGQAAGHAPPPTALPRDSLLRAALRARYRTLSPDARRFALMAALDDRMDADTAVRAAAASGLDLAALQEAEDAGFLRPAGEDVAPPGALVGSTVRAEAPLADRRATHALLADVLDPAQHALRRAWHRAALADGADRALADELTEAAHAARRAGDHLASSRAYRRAAALTPEPDTRALRLLAAAADAWLAGRSGRSRALLREARPLTATAELRGLADLLYGGIELRDGVPALASQTMLAAAEQLGGGHRELALSALMLAGEASCVAGDCVRYFAIAERAARLRRPGDPSAVRLFLDHFAGMAAALSGRHAEALEPLRRVTLLADAVDDPAAKIWASQAAYTLGDAERAHELAVAAVSAAGSRGPATLVPWALVYASLAELLLDRYSSAVSSSEEGLRLARALGQPNCAVDHITILALQAALRGDGQTAQHRLDAAAREVATRGLGRPGALGSWVSACVDLADDRPADAMDRFRLMAAGTGRVHPGIRAMAVPHFVEAAVRCGQHGAAARALATYDAWAGSTSSPARLALSHRCHALLAVRDAEAEEHFRQSIDLHRASGTALELAKTELFYARHLRRCRRPRAARELLRDAVKIFQRYDAQHWARRAGAEMRAAGEPAVRAEAGAPAELTPQQLQISRLVAEGATNREIAARLFISHRTVDHHLRNIFAKLGVRSRVELAGRLR